jgi:hypothetical protein
MKHWDEMSQSRVKRVDRRPEVTEHPSRIRSGKNIDRGMLPIFDVMSWDRNVTTQVKEGDGNVTSDDTPPPIKGDIKSRPLGIGDGLSQEP